MKIASNPYCYTYFCAENKTKSNNDENPISKRGEQQKLLKATVIAGLGVGARALWYLCDDGFAFEGLYNLGENITKKNKKGLMGSNKTVNHLGAWAALMAGFVVAVAAIYTIVKTPEVMYNGKINAFKKGKDMDVYVKGNKVEKELYDQMNEKAKDATEDEKKVLSEQYLKLTAAKNQTPDFIEVKSQNEMVNK